MTEATGGSMFFEWSENFSTIPEAARREGNKTLTEINSLVKGMVEAAARANGIDFNPLGGAFAAVSRDVQAIQNELLKLKRTYEEMARTGQRPAEPFDIAAQRVARQGAARALGSFDAGSSGQPGAAEARRAIEQAVTQGAAQFGRELQSSLRQTLKGVVDDVSSYAGSNANRLRANLIRAETGGPGAAAATVTEAPRVRAAIERVAEERTNREAEALGPKVTLGPDVRARAKKVAQEVADEVSQEAFQAALKALNAAAFKEGLGSGRLQRLGADLGRDRNTGVYESATHGRLSLSNEDHAYDLQRVEEAYAKHLARRFAAGEEVIAADERMRSAEDKAAARLEAGNADLLARERGAIQSALQAQNTARFNEGLASGRLQNLGNGVGRDVSTGIFESKKQGQLSSNVPEHENDIANAEAGYARLRRKEIDEGNQVLKAEADLAEVERRRATQLAKDEARPQGIGQNLVSGFLSSGFGGAGGVPSNLNSVFDGLARSAGTTLKYTALYQVLGQLQGALSDVVKQFLDANDSVTELDVAMGHAGEITGGFVNSLGDVAAVGGFNVGEAMDVAASGIRAFGSQADDASAANERLGASFATQASRIAVLSKTSLTDAAGNLKAIAAGFNLPKNNLGFTQVADAIAGAKLAGGGDEKQIGQGLANSALIFKQLGFSLNESATIISRINAETDESGTLIANRVSRLSQIIGGSSGRNFIGQLNQTVKPEQRVDTQASVKDQLLQLAKIYKDASAAIKAQIVSALGGTAQARETIILLSQIPELTKKADQGFEGKATAEFQKRLDNVRSQLQQIKGNVDQIIVNVANSGVAVPIVALVDGLRGVTSILREVTQLLNLIPTPFIAAAASAAALYGTLKLVRTIAAAGGLGGFLRAQEERLLPGQALARQTLAERRGGGGDAGLVGVGNERIRTEQTIVDRLRAVGAERVAAEGRLGLSGRFDRAGDAASRIREGVRSGVQSALAATVTRPVIDPFRASLAAGRTFPSLAGVPAAALARAQDLALGLAGGIANSRLVGAAGNLRAFGPGAVAQAGVDRLGQGITAAGDRAARAIGAPFRALERAALGISATVAAERGLLTGLGPGLYTRRVLGGQAVTDLGAQLRQGAANILGRDYTLPLAQRAAPVTNAFNTALGQSGSLGVATGAAARAVLEPVGRTLTSTIAGVYNRTGAIAQASLASVRGVGQGLSRAFAPLTNSFRSAYLSSGGSLLSAFGASGGVAGRAALRPITSVAGIAGQGLARGFGALSSFAGGPIGIAIAGATIASELKSAADAIGDARKNLDELKNKPDLAAGEAPRTFTSDELFQRAQQFGTARNIANDSRSGFFGTLANFATGGAGDRAVADAQLNRTLTEADAARAKAAEQAVAAARVASNNPGQQIDSTSAEGITSSLQQLAQSGRSASFQMLALKSSIDLITKSGKTGTLFLDAAAQQQVATAGNEAATKFVQQAIRPQYQYRDAKGQLVSLPADQELKPEDFQKIFEPAGPGGGFITRPGVTKTPGFTFSTDQFKKLQDVTNQTILADQKKGVDLGGKKGEQQLADDLKKAYQGLLPSDQLTAAALAAASDAADQAAALSTPEAKIASLQQDAISAVSTAQAKAQEKADAAKLKSLINGTPDNSQQVQANTFLSELIAARKKTYAGLLANGESEAEANAALEGLDAQINAARIAKIQADQAAAKAEIDASQRARDVALSAAKSSAERRRQALSYFLKDIQTAIDSGDPELIRAVMGAASKDEINTYRKQLADNIAADEAAAEAEAKRNAALAQLPRPGDPNFIGPVGPGEVKPGNPNFIGPVGPGQVKPGDPNFIGPVGPGTPTTPFGPPPSNSAGDKLKRDRDRLKRFDDGQKGTVPSTDSYYGQSGAGGVKATPEQIDAANAAAAAEKSRDSLAASKAAVQRAQADYDAAKKGSLEQAQAQQALYAAKNAYADAQRAAASAARHVGEFKDSAVQEARLAVADAAANLHVFAKGTKEYYDAQNAYIQAQRDLTEAQSKAYFLHLEAGSDLTDPVAQARLKAREAAAKLARDRKAGKPQDVIDQDRIDLKNAQNGAEAAAFSQRLSDAKTNDELGRTSHKAYLQYLQNEHDRLTKIKGKTRQQKDELNEIDQAIKSANEQLSGQFNIGDIKVPTIYEVRRAIANATGSNVSAVQNSVVNNNQQVTVNGADFAKVVDYLKQALGPQGASRISSAPRKG